MDYCIVKNGIIENIIFCEDDATAALFDGVPYYDGASIGAPYDPPTPEPTYTADDLFSALLGQS